MAKLSDKQRRFCLEYVIDCNGTQAAIRAGYSERTAQVQAARLLTKAMVKAKVRRFQAKIAEKCEISAEKVLRELACLGFSNMADYMTVSPDGEPVLDFSGLTREQTAALVEVTTDYYIEGQGKTKKRHYTKVKFKLADKRAALVDIGKHLKMFSGDELPPPGGTTINVILVDNPKDRECSKNPQG